MYAENLNTDNLNSLESKQLIEREPIKNTPFTLIKSEDGILITLGKYRLNATPLKSVEEATNYLVDNLWNIVLTIAVLVKNFKEDDQ